MSRVGRFIIAVTLIAGPAGVLAAPLHAGPTTAAAAPVWAAENPLANTDVDPGKAPDAGADLSLLETQLGDKDPDVRCAAVKELGKVKAGAVQALVLLDRAIHDRRSKVRYDAALALGELGQNKEALDRVLAVLDRALDDNNDTQESNAHWQNTMAITTVNIAAALGKIGGEKVLPLLEKALNNMDQDARAQTAMVLGKLGGEKARDILIRRAPSEVNYKDLTVIKRVLSAVYKGDPKAEEAMRRIDEQQAAIADAKSGALDGDKALGLLEKLLTYTGDAGPAERTAAVAALGRLGGDQARDIIIRHIESELEARIFAVIKEALAAHFPNDPKAAAAIQRVDERMMQLREHRAKRAPASAPAPATVPDGLLKR